MDAVQPVDQSASRPVARLQACDVVNQLDPITLTNQHTQMGGSARHYDGAERLNDPRISPQRHLL